MNFLLTGGAGYIGSNTCLALLDAGHQVTIIDNLSTGNKDLIPNKAKFIKCNINEINIVSDLLESNKYDAVFHFAGYIQVEESVSNPSKYFDNNSKNSEIFFNECKKNNLNNIIFSSTAATYGIPQNNEPIKEEDVLSPLNPYGESKILTEKYLQENSKLNYIILRYFNVAGADPKMRSGLISKKATHLIKIACEVVVGKRDEITIFGTDYSTPDGSAIRDYIHVSDLARIHVKAAEYLIANKKSQIINCGYGKGFSVKDVLKVFNKINKKPLKIVNGARRAGDSPILVSNISKLKNLLDWKPQHDDLNFIIKTSIEWEVNLTKE